MVFHLGERLLLQHGATQVYYTFPSHCNTPQHAIDRATRQRMASRREIPKLNIRIGKDGKTYDITDLIASPSEVPKVDRCRHWLGEVRGEPADEKGVITNNTLVAPVRAGSRRFRALNFEETETRARARGETSSKLSRRNSSEQLAPVRAGSRLQGYFINGPAQSPSVTASAG
jgi:hypothetical protein